MIFELAKDFRDTVAAMPAEHPRRRTLELFEEAIRRDIHFIARHPTTMFQCMWNTCWWYDCPEAGEHFEEPEAEQTQPPPWIRPEGLHRLLEAWRVARRGAGLAGLWLRTLAPPAVAVGSGQIAVLRGHKSVVSSIAFSPDGRWVASGAREEVDPSNRDATVRIWSATRGEQMRCLYGHKYGIYAVAFSPDGKTVASGGAGNRDAVIRIWDPWAADELMRLEGHASSVIGVAFSPDGRAMASASWDGTVRIWDMPSGRLRRQITNRRGGAEARCVAYCPDGDRLACGGDDGTIQVRDARTGRLCAVGLTLPGQIVSGVAWSPDSNRIAAIFRPRHSIGRRGLSLLTVPLAPARSNLLKRLLRRLTRPRFRPVQTLDLSGGEPAQVAYSPDGQLLAVAVGSAIRLIAAENGRFVDSLLGHTAEVTSVAFSRDGKLLASGSRDLTIRLWSLTGSRRLPKRKHIPAALAWQIGAQAFLAIGPNKRLAKFDPLAPHAAAIELEGCDTWPGAVAFSGNGRVLAMAANNEVFAWDANDGRLLWKSCVHEQVTSLAVAYKGQRLAVGTDKWRILILDGQTGREEVRRDLPNIPWQRNAQFMPWGQPISIAWSHDSTMLAVSSWNRRVLAYSVVETRSGLQLSGPAALESPDSAGTVPAGRSLAFSYNNRLVIGTVGKDTLIWNVATGRLQARVEGIGENLSLCKAHRQPYRAMAVVIETRIEQSGTGTPVAWFPDPLHGIATTSDSTRWMASSSAPDDKQDFNGAEHGFTGIELVDELGQGHTRHR